MYFNLYALKTQQMGRKNIILGFSYRMLVVINFLLFEYLHGNVWFCITHWMLLLKLKSNKMASEWLCITQRETELWSYDVSRVIPLEIVMHCNVLPVVFLSTHFIVVLAFEYLFIPVRVLVGRAMAQVVSRRPLTAEARVRARINPYGICGGQSDAGTCFSPSTSVFPCLYHSTVSLQVNIIWVMRNMLT
jgi:hypothetical protein